MATVTPDKVSRVPAEDDTEQKFQYPGVPTTCDGAEAVVWVETSVCQGSGAYPITSSTTMGGGFNAAMMNGVPNLWGISSFSWSLKANIPQPLSAKGSPLRGDG